MDDHKVIIGSKTADKDIEMITEKLKDMRISGEKVKRGYVQYLKHLHHMRKHREKNKEKIKEELFHYRNAYSYVDELFTIEIKNAQNYQFFFFFLAQI